MGAAGAATLFLGRQRTQSILLKKYNPPATQVCYNSIRAKMKVAQFLPLSNIFLSTKIRRCRHGPPRPSQSWPKSVLFRTKIDKTSSSHRRRILKMWMYTQFLPRNNFVYYTFPRKLITAVSIASEVGTVAKFRWNVQLTGKCEYVVPLWHIWYGATLTARRSPVRPPRFSFAPPEYVLIDKKNR